MRIYLDNNATTPLHPEVLASLGDALSLYGNPSSIHEEGQRARQALELARESVADLIGASAREIVFTSGGTESNNAAIYGSVVAAFPPGTGYNIVTSAIEHPSVLEPVRDLATRGGSATVVPCGADGVVSAADVIDAISSNTRLVTIMLANNETGAIQPVAEIAAACRERKIHIHCDAVQAAGRIPIDVGALAVDSLALSAHKAHGPKGIGALYVRRGTVLHPILLGGAQERRRRAGTENAPLAAAFGTAARLAAAGLTEAGRIAELRDSMEGSVRASLASVRINAAGTGRLPNTSSLTFPGVDGEALVIALDLAGVSISTGSACSSGRVEPSHVLLAMGVSEKDARSSVRISLNRFNTAEEIGRAAGLLVELAGRTRRDSLPRAHA